MPHTRAALLLAASATLLLFACSPPLRGEEMRWKTGGAFEEQLRKPESAFWPEAPLKLALMNMSRTYRVAILLDRRVDPSRVVKFVSRNEPLQQTIDRFAEEQGLGVSRLGATLYVGPPETAERLRTVAEWHRGELENMPPACRATFETRRPLRWDAFDTPHDVVAALAEEAGVEMVDDDRIPHDLWSEADFPPTPLSDRLTLVLAQFHMMYVLSPDGRRMTFYPIPDIEKLAAVRSYPIEGDGSNQIREWEDLSPNCEFKIAQNRIYARGSTEDLDRIEGKGPTEPSVPVAASVEDAPGAEGPPLESRRFTARVQNQPMKKVVEGFAAQLPIEITVDWDACKLTGVNPDRLVSFQVRNATLDGLFHAILQNSGCRFVRQGAEIRIYPIERRDQNGH